MKENYNDKIKSLIDNFVKEIYLDTKKFPKEEIFGITSQIRRASLSIMLNYIEGYARRRKAVLKNFIEISYGSLKETEYLILFCEHLNYLNKNKSYKLIKKADRIGAMLWGIIKKL